MTDLNTITGSIPENYHEVLYWKLTGNRSRVIIMNLMAIPLFMLSGLIFFALAISLGKLPEGFNFGLVEVGMVFAGILLTLILHELMHGLAMRAFGARPSYGVLWKAMAFYATSPGYAFKRWEYLVIALAPFAGITILMILGMGLLNGTNWVALFWLCGTINASGAIGDLWMSTIVLRYAPVAYVIDERDGLRVFLPKP